MKLVFISDIHDRYEYMKMPEGDILVVCGDLTGMGTFNQLTMVNNWFGALKSKYRHIVAIAGNHDWLFQDSPSVARALMTNCTYLQNEGAVIEGLRFWGSPCTPRFFDWAFNYDRGPDIKRFWDMIPESLDVLITHGPPYAVGDATPRGELVGCKDLLDAVQRTKPKIHAFGHIHCGYGLHGEISGTQFINASTCDERYRPHNDPIVVELNGGNKDEQSTGQPQERTESEEGSGASGLGSNDSGTA